MIDAIASHLLALPPWVALLVVFAAPALESSAFVGFVFPGEIALILGGVMASEGNVSLGAVLAAGVTGAIVGDSVGYALGRRYGRRMLDGTVGRFVKKSHLDRGEKYLAERGGRAVFFGRFTAALRVMVPGLAGVSGLRYRTFVTFNVASGIAWGTMSVLLGYLGGRSWRHVEHVASRLGLAALVLVVVTLLGGVLLRRTGARRFTRLAARITSSPAVQQTRERFPRTTGWVGARFDPTLGTGLALTAALTVAVAATWTFLGITQDVLAHEELALWDPGIHVWVLAHRVPSLDAFFKTVTWLGASAVTAPLLALAGGFLARRRRSWAPLLDIFTVYGTAVLLHAVVGELVHRHRPPASDWLASAGGWAYPSGHTTQAVAAWGILALIVSADAPSRTRVLAGSAATGAAVLVAASRIYLGMHWATDVLGAAAMSAAVLATWSVAHRSILHPRRARHPLHTPSNMPSSRRAVGLGMRWRELIARVATREVLTFLGVGGTGYVVDVAAFNLLRSVHPLADLDPSVARTVAVAAAMCVTYVGNRSLTWRHHTAGNQRRELTLFVLFNIVGFGFSLVTLVVSHDVLRLTSRLADNVSANVVGLALGTIFRYVTYKRFVFATPVSPVVQAGRLGRGLRRASLGSG